MSRFFDSFFSKEHFYSLGHDSKEGGAYFSIPVSNRYVDYEEYYRISSDELKTFVEQPDLAIAFAEKCRKQEMDDRLILTPGTDRGVARRPYLQK